MPEQEVKNWYERSLDDEESSERYFSIGHGDFDYEEGIDSCFKVWALLDGAVVSSPEYCPDDEGDFHDEQGRSQQTHQSLWGQRVNYGIKGRYETETGRLSVVLPHSFHKMTKQLLSLLRNELGTISSVDVFK